MLDALEKLEEQMGKKLGDTDEPAAGQRPLRREVLHAGHDEHDSQPRPERRDRRRPRRQERQPALRLRLLPPLHPDVRRSGARYRHGARFDHIFDGARRRPRPSSIPTSPPKICKAIIADYKKLVQKETGKPFPQDALEQLAMSRDAVFRSWWNDQGHVLPQDGKDSRRPRHRRQRAGHGVRQPGRHLRHRRRLHARSRHRREGLLRRVPGQRAGRRRGRRHPHAAADLRARRTWNAGGLQPAPRDHQQAWKSTTATCRISSSPSKDGKLYMLQTRNGKRTGPAAVRIAVEMVEEGLIDKKEAVLRVASAAARSASAPGARSRRR